MNTSSNELIKRLPWNGSDFLKQDIERLLLGESITKSIQSGIVFSKLETQEDTVWGLFFFSGYLTLAKEFTSFREGYQLKIPNQEVFELYKNIV